MTVANMSTNSLRIAVAILSVWFIGIGCETLDNLQTNGIISARNLKTSHYSATIYRLLGEESRALTETLERTPDPAETAGLMLSRSLEAINRGLDFFTRNTDQLTLDVLLGAKICGDQLRAALQHVSEENAYLSAIIPNLMEKIENLIAEAWPYVKNNYPLDIQRVGNIIYLSMNWDVAPRWLTLYPMNTDSDLDVGHDSRYNETYYDETVSDMCMAGLLTRATPSKDFSCRVDDDCIQILFHRSHRYALTHQLLYLMVGVKAGCTNQLNDKLRELAPSFAEDVSAASLMDQYCKHLYMESENIAAQGFPETYRDIFNEQGVLCGVQNYQNFFRLDWLARVLSWQSPSGCFKDPPPVTEAMATSQDVERHHRQKRRDAIIEDSCSTHLTTTGIAYFGNYVRYFVST